jgi:hypothetical protein
MPKPLSRKSVRGTLGHFGEWNVVYGQLERYRGRPTDPLFNVVAEKLPYDCLGKVAALLREYKMKTNGVYLVHDSMGYARYGGRGQIFSRLAAHNRKYKKELHYFSFYTIRKKSHERELETAILRAAGPQMVLNVRKVRDRIEPGRVSDYEAGAFFVERQKRRGKKQNVFVPRRFNQEIR